MIIKRTKKGKCPLSPEVDEPQRGTGRIRQIVPECVAREPRVWAHLPPSVCPFVLDLAATMAAAPDITPFQSLSNFGISTMARETSQHLMASELAKHMSFDHPDLAEKYFQVSLVDERLVRAIDMNLKGPSFSKAWDTLRSPKTEEAMYGPLVCSSLLCPLWPFSHMAHSCPSCRRSNHSRIAS